MSPISDKQFIFVVGAPRSGTTWLHHMLAEHPDAIGLNEELTVFTYLHHLDHRFQSEKFHLDQGHWRQGAPLIYTEEEFYLKLRTIALDAYERVLRRKPEATHVLDKHPAYALRLPLVNRLFPNCRVIHIIRDGREVAVSMMSAKRRIGFGEGEIRGATRDWVQHIRGARASANELGKERYMEVRYEDLMKQPERILKEIYQFAGLSFPDHEVARIARENNIKTKQVSGGDTSLNSLRATPGAIWKTKLSLEERWAMERMAGDLLQELGYSQSDWWAVKKSDKIRMALFPVLRKVGNTLGSAKHTWRTPLFEKL